MMDLISRQAAIDALSRGSGCGNSCRRGIERIPSVDAVPVVRCKDCKWWREETDHTCRLWGGASPRKANGYCDDGERNEE